MSKESEKMIRSLQVCLDGMDVESEVEMDQVIAQFVESCAFHVDANSEPDAYDYLEMAQNAGTRKNRIKYARKALELEPELLEAEALLIFSECRSMDECQRSLDNLLKKGEWQLLKRDISREQDAGHYYHLMDTRPYIRTYRSYVEVLIEQGKYRKAVDACKDILYLNDSDNLGVRYVLMALYAALEDRACAEQLYQEFIEDETGTMLLPLIAMYYRLDDTEQALFYLLKLCERAKDAKKGFRAIEKREREYFEMLSAPYYKPFSAHEIVLAYDENLFLYERMIDFVPWLIRNCPAKKKGQTRQNAKKDSEN